MRRVDGADELNAIEEAAATWLVERDRGLAPARARELERWLAADARHAAAFAALAETWAMLGERGAPRASEEATELAEARGEGAWRWRTLAAAAALALGVFGWWRGAEELREVRHYAAASSTEVGVLRRLELPDGSVVQLNTDSAVEIRFEERVRRVQLSRGEAHFTVARDAARPFVVSAGDVNVRVLGTVFNVRLRSEAVDVLVTEGKVRVQSPASELAKGGAVSELTAGHRVSVGRVAAAALEAAVVEAPKPIAATPTEVRQTLAWQERRLDFDAAPLSEIVAEVNRYSRHKLVIADAELETRKFGGSFPANDYATLVRMLEADFGVVAERKAEETLLRVRRR